MDIAVSDSVLRCLRRFQSHTHLIDVLCQAAYTFHRHYIDECTEIGEQLKLTLQQRAQTVNTLKNIARRRIRADLSRLPVKERVDRAVGKLPLALFLRQYLLFDVV
jgi:hypothetical protein